MNKILKDKLDFDGEYLDYDGIIAYCDHCGFAIYSPDEALIVSVTGDRIHADCWAEYALEHMFDFVKKVSEDECRCLRVSPSYDCGD